MTFIFFLTCSLLTVLCRGGRADFKWEDVRNDQHRENYLGHSLMARTQSNLQKAFLLSQTLADPSVAVGRWQKNKDLSWYAKGDDSQEAQDAAQARMDEIRRIKEAEQEALSAALGFPVEPSIRDGLLLGAGQGDVKPKVEEDRSDVVKRVHEARSPLESERKEKKTRDRSRRRDKDRRHRSHRDSYERFHRQHRSRSRHRGERRRSRSRSYERVRDDARSRGKRSRHSRSRSHERTHNSERGHHNIRRRSHSPDRRRRDSYRNDGYNDRR